MKPDRPRIPLFDAPFVFLRHGETETNRLKLTAGMTDVPLNATGRAQAERAAAALQGRGIDAIYASPLARARATADCVALALALPVTTLPELAERNWGALEGKPRESRVREMTPPGGESLDAFRQRTLAGLAKIARSALPLVVAHSGTFRVLCEVLDVAAAPTAQVENSRPLRFVPPHADEGCWSIEPLQRPPHAPQRI